MKKIILTLALAAVLVVPAAVSAQTTPTTKKENTECCKSDSKCKKEEKKECTKSGKCSKKSKASMKSKSGKMAKGKRMGKRPAVQRANMRRGGENPMFKGITLTDDQKQKIEDIRAKRSASTKEARAKVKTDVKEAKTRSREEMKKMYGEFEKEIEQILTPDQLKQYNANKAEMEQKRAERASRKAEKK